MPVKSEKQRRFMYASLAGKTDVPPSVAKKFVGPKAHAEGGEIMRSTGIGGPTAQEMQAYHASRKPKDKPPAGIRAELDAMKQEKANEAGMKAHEGRKLAKGGSCYVSGGSVKGAGCAQRGVRKCKVV